MWTSRAPTRSLTGSRGTRWDSWVSSIHDLRVVEGRERINVIFDMVVPYRYTEEEEKELAKTVRKKLRQVDHRYQCVITTEKSYIAQGEEE